ncbi:MAG: hypothetical protein K1X35_11145 [Caulobacteraceae bacterium]|nr:hypothetical protein [Caulobacteraceae bacterium]
MLTDAISSEGYKLWRNRTALFWGFGFVPLLALAIQGFTEIYLRMQLPAAARAMPSDIGRTILLGAAQASGPLTILFILIGAAVLFGGEYRWETWRLMAPRNSRVNHVLGKAAVFALASLATIFAIVLMHTIAGLLGSFINGSPVEWKHDNLAIWFAVFFSLVLTAWLQLLQAGFLVALCVVLFRSMIGAVIIPLFVGLIQAIGGQQLQAADPTHPELWRMLLLPGMAADILRAHVGGKALMGMQMIEPKTALLSLLAQLVWIIGALAAAILLFRRQDLSKE